MIGDRLVLVDANETLREHVTASLIAQGYNCVGVRDLQGAADLSAQMSISGVLINASSLDEQLVAAMVRFRHHHPDLPLLAFDPPELRTDEPRLGCRPVVRKHLRLVSTDGALTGPTNPTWH